MGKGATATKSLAMVNPAPPARDSRTLIKDEAANEYVFAVVGHIGSGTSTVAQQLESKLAESGYDCTILKAQEVITDWADTHGSLIPAREDGARGRVKALQDAGDAMRQSGDHAAVALALVRRIRAKRAEKRGLTPSDGEAVAPDGEKRAYILDSIRHPAEVLLLRHVYAHAFALIGVVCAEDVRLQRIIEKLDVGNETAAQVMARDAKDRVKWGQRVSDAFHLADAFLDNTKSRYEDDKSKKTNKAWRLPDEVARFVQIVTQSEIVRPTIAEMAMFQAYGSQLRSACLSRQVGASIVDARGNVIATGTNEAPKAGGGVYGLRDNEQIHLGEVVDERCAFSTSLGYCSNTREQIKFVNDVVAKLVDANVVDGAKAAEVAECLRDSRVGDLLEFSRAIHAEMDALISASRTGASTVGATAFVTTFPCHYCARHLVAAGIDAVYYIEPYPKSKAFELHRDSISPVEKDDWTPPSRGGDKVLFAPFTGVAPRLYVRSFLKDRELKNRETGDLHLGKPDYMDAWHLDRVGYTELEAKLSKD